MNDDKFCINCRYFKGPGEGRDIIFARCTHDKSIMMDGDYFIAGATQHHYCSTMRSGSLLNSDCGPKGLLFESVIDTDKCHNDYKGEEERRTL